MSIELSSPPKGAKVVTSGEPHGKKAGKPADASGSGGFSALMSLLSAAEDAAVSLVPGTSSADDPLTEKEGLNVDISAAGGGAALLLPPELPQAFAAGVAVGNESAAATGVVLSQLADGAVPQPAVAALDLPVKDSKDIPMPSAESGSLPRKGGFQASLADNSALQKAALASSASDALSVRADAGQTAVDLAQASPVSALLAQKSVVLAHAASIAQQDAKELRAAAVSQSAIPAADAVTTLLAGGSDLAQPQGRFGARPGSGQSGSSGFEGAFGQAMSAASRADAVFEVPPAAAVVADTAVAETVSYWASQGVQTAELTLEGFGDEPVEVSILLNGDQAQIDFRTDQAGVRQVLEAAVAQLKDLLSSQGLQLAGVSVGTSGKGSENGGERRPRPGGQQVTMVKTEPVGTAPKRAANQAVGRSLDLFV